MKTNRFAATVVRNERPSPSFRILGGFACAMITALVAGSASAAPPADVIAPAKSWVYTKSAPSSALSKVSTGYPTGTVHILYSHLGEYKVGSHFT